MDTGSTLENLTSGTHVTLRRESLEKRSEWEADLTCDILMHSAGFTAPEPLMLCLACSPVRGREFAPLSRGRAVCARGAVLRARARARVAAL